MNRKIVHFDGVGYNEAIRTLNEIIDAINKHSQELSANGYTLTIEDIKLISERDNKFKNKVYANSLNEICNIFGVDYNKVCTFEYGITNSMFSEMASGKCRYLYNLYGDLSKYFVSYQYLADGKYIDIIDNVASKTIEADELIRELYTSYTKNER